MHKIYIVRLSDAERKICLDVVKKLKGSSQKVRRAHILLKADADGPGWTDQAIADAFLCTRKSVENVRMRLVTEGFEIALHGKKRETPPRAKCLDGTQEAEVIALRLAENELSTLTRQCVKGCRFGTIEELRDVVEAWAKQCNAKQKGVIWQFNCKKAKVKRRTLFPKIKN